MKTTFLNPDDILNFTLTIEPDEGMYKGGSFVFTFAINQNFPHDPPKVKCTQKIYHPNIDLDGNVCLNILREDWKPVLNLNAVIIGMQVRLASMGLVDGILTDAKVSVSRAKCFRSPKQGSCRRPSHEQRWFQEECANSNEWRISKRSFV